jgi:hypothetical protein
MGILERRVGRLFTVMVQELDDLRRELFEVKQSLSVGHSFGTDTMQPGTTTFTSLPPPVPFSAVSTKFPPSQPLLTPHTEQSNTSSHSENSLSSPASFPTSQSSRQRVLPNTPAVTCLSSFIVTKPNLHTMRPCTVVFNSDHPNQLITTSMDGSMAFWETTSRNGNGGATYSINRVHNLSLIDFGWPESVSIRPGGHEMVCAVTHSTSKRQDRGTPSDLYLLHHLTNFSKLGFCKVLVNSNISTHSKQITCVDWVRNEDSGSSNMFVTSSSDKTVLLWSLSATSFKTGKVESSQLIATAHSASVAHLSCCKGSNREWVLTGGRDGRVCAFSLSSQSCLTLARDNSCRVNFVEESPANAHLVLASCIGKGPHLLNIIDKRCPQNQPAAQITGLPVNSSLIVPSWNPSGRFISLGSLDGSIAVWDVRRLPESPLTHGDAVCQISAHDKRARQTAWSPTVPLMVSISSSNRAQIVAHTLRI